MIYNQDGFIKNMVVDNFHKDSKQKPNLLEYTRKITTYISNITEEQKKTYISGPDMNVLLYLLRTLLLSSTGKTEGIASPSNDIKKWMTSLTKLPVKSTGGWVYIADIFDTSFEIVIKTPKENSEIENMSLLREFAIANIGINTLRYIIPTFIYTFDIFSCNPPDKDTGDLKIETMSKDCNQPNSLYIMCEKVEGQTMKELIKNQIKFKDWLFIFLQILLTLEIAQRKLYFTHFDLHTGNTIIQTGKILSYNVNIDDTNYTIKNSNLTPVIIDFGFATLKLEGKTVGSTDFPEYGMLDFMVPGYDMYKFLCSSASDAAFRGNHRLFKQIINIFKFYGNDDTLNILRTKEVGIEKTIKDFCKEGSYTNIAKYTPLMLFNWLCTNYGDLIPHNTRDIIQIPRSNFLTITYSKHLKDHNDFLGEVETGVQHAIELIERCLTNKSYVLTIYNISVLEKLNERLECDKLERYIKSRRSTIENINIKSLFIKKDTETLEKIFDIKIPIQEELDTIIDDVLTINIRHNSSKDKVNSVDKLVLTTQYQNEINFYLQLYYTILEVKLEEIYKFWIDRFLSSDVFKFYKENNFKVERASRWANTILGSIKE